MVYIHVTELGLCVFKSSESCCSCMFVVSRCVTICLSSCEPFIHTAESDGCFTCCEYYFCETELFLTLDSLPLFKSHNVKVQNCRSNS